MNTQKFFTIIGAGFLGMFLLFFIWNSLNLELKLYNVLVYWDIYLVMHIITIKNELKFD